MSRKNATFSAAGLVLYAVLGARGGWAADCNQNGKDDLQDIASGVSSDCNANGFPDECEQGPGRVTFEYPRTILSDFSSAGGELVADDFDGDGDVDIAVAGHPAAVLLNQGDGTYTLTADSVLPQGATMPVAADLDGDGDIDLATVTNILSGDGSAFLSGNVSIIKNDGHAAFSEADTFSLPGFRRALYPVLCDFDSDGDQDLVVVDYGGSRDDPGSRIAVLLNDGGGRFPSPVTYAVREYPKQLVAADPDGDVLPDLAVSSTSTDAPSLLWNQGDGHFGEAVPLAVGHSTRRLWAGDLDSDGDVDLIAGEDPDDLDSPANLSILLNAGGRSFSTPATHGVLGSVGQLETADLNGDGTLDIIASLQAGSYGYVSVLEGIGAGIFDPPVSFYNEWGAAHPVHPVDLDGDRDLDLVSTGSNVHAVNVLFNVTDQGLSFGCGPFLRGDANADGGVSISDALMLRRYLGGDRIELSCMDAADVSDNERVDQCHGCRFIVTLFFFPDWSLPVPGPFPEPGFDPTAVAASDVVCECSDPNPMARLDCAQYQVEPPVRTGDLIRIGDIEASPGAEVLIPVYLTSSVRVEAIQLILEYDPATYEISDEDLHYEGTFYGLLGRHPLTSVLTTHPGAGVVTAAIAGSFTSGAGDIPPGSDILVAWIPVKISEDVAPGRVLSLAPTNGPDGLGVGPFHLRNEITFQGGARLVSVLPELEGGTMAIVGDQAFFRGDSNGDEKLDMSDAIYTLGALFIQSRPISCLDAADSNDDGEVNISDPIFALNFLFTGGLRPPPPYPEKGADPTYDELGCYIVKRPS